MAIGYFENNTGFNNVLKYIIDLAHNKLLGLGMVVNLNKATEDALISGEIIIPNFMADYPAVGGLPEVGVFNFCKSHKGSQVEIKLNHDGLNAINYQSEKKVLYIKDILETRLKNVTEVYTANIDGEDTRQTITYRDRCVRNIIFNSSGLLKGETREIYSMREDGELILIWKDQELVVKKNTGFGSKIPCLCEEVLFNGTIDLLEMEENEQ